LTLIIIIIIIIIIIVVVVVIIIIIIIIIIINLWDMPIDQASSSRTKTKNLSSHHARHCVYT